MVWSTDGRMIRLFDNPYSENDRAVLSGKITDSYGPGRLYIRGAGRLALTNQNTFAAEVVVQSVEGPITLDLNHVLNLGNINNKLVLSDVNFNIGSTFGNATKQASLSGSLGVDIAKYSNLTLNGSANPGIGKTLTKKGLGGLTLNGLSISGDVDFQAGSLNLGSGVLGLPGGSVNIASGLTLKTAGVISKPIVGDMSTTVALTGNSIIGSADAGQGYAYEGMLNVGSNSVQLVHPTWAPLAGALLDGGKIQGGMSGLKLLPATASNGTTVSGLSGKITGNVYSDNATVYAVDMNTFEEGQIEMTGVVDGSGDFYNVAFTGFLRGAALDDSKGTVKTYSTMGGTSRANRSDAVRPLGDALRDGEHGRQDDLGRSVRPDLRLRRPRRGSTTKPINAVMKIILEDYAPVAGDSFNLFNTGTWGTFGKGHLSYGANFALDFNAGSADGGSGLASRADAGLPADLHPRRRPSRPARSFRATTWPTTCRCVPR